MSEKIQDYVNQAKSWLKSRTVWGIIVMVVNFILIQAGEETGTDINDIVDTAFEGGSMLAKYADSGWSIGVEAFGAILAFWGRLKAKLPLSIFGSKI